MKVMKLYPAVFATVIFGAVFIITSKVYKFDTPLAKWTTSCECEKELNQPTCKLSLLKSEKDFLDYFTKTEGNCSSWKAFGLKDGMKYVCVDPKFNIKPGNCTVLSFGINNEWSFDDGFDKFGCKLYAFDPTMGKESHQRSKNIKFLSIGVGSISGKQMIGYSKNHALKGVDTYNNLLKLIGMENKTIDYLKMDIDFAELNFFMQALIETPFVFKHIKQFGMEVHPPVAGGQGLGFKSEYQLFWLTFQMLKCHGFTLIHSRKAGYWWEVVWAQDRTW